MEKPRLSIPENSLLYEDHKKADYHDAYAILVSGKVSIDQVAATFIDLTPDWMNNLSKWKDEVKLNYQLKEKSEIDQTKKRFDQPQFTKGMNAGHFKVIDKNEYEIILGRDKNNLKHLISLMFLPAKEDGAPKKHLLYSTSVQVKNWMGKMYLFTVKSFHQEIAPFILKEVAEKLHGDPQSLQKIKEISI